MAVHFKFSSTQELETIKIDGKEITVGDLKRVIAEQKNLGKSQDSELAIIDPDTGVAFDDSETIDRNRSVLVQRVPTGKKAKKLRVREEFNTAASEDVGGGTAHQANGTGVQGALGTGDEGSGLQTEGNVLVSPEAPAEFKGLSEEERIQAVMNQGSSQYDPSL